MKPRNKAVIAIVLIAIVAVVALMLRPTAPRPAADQPVQETTVPVRTITAEQRTIPQTLSQPGSLEAWELAHVSGTTGSRIERIRVDEGDRVQAGQIIAEMEAANLRQAEIQVNTARADLERMEKLVELGAVSRQQYEQARAQYETAQSNYRLIRENTYLRSPITGVVTDRYFVAGEIFAAGADRSAIVTIMNLHPLKVTINLSERYYPLVRQGAPVEVRLDTYGDRVFQGQVEHISPAVSPETRTFRIEIRIDNQDRTLSPGMFARVSLSLEEVSGIFVPGEVVRRDQTTGEDYVFIVEGGYVRRAPVTLGTRVEELQQVVSGLEEGAQVVSEGLGRVEDGTSVRVVG